jgi:hypothetical protein
VEELSKKIKASPEKSLRYLEDSNGVINDTIKELAFNQAKTNLINTNMSNVKNALDKKIAPSLYFLKPDDARKAIQSSIGNTESGYKDAKMMIKVLYGLGIVIISTTFLLDVYAIVTGQNWETFVPASGVLGSIGLVTIYTSTFKMHKEMKDTVSDQIQLKVALFGFLGRLSVLHQDQYASTDDRIKVSNEIANIVTHTMKLTQTLCETPKNK